MCGTESHEIVMKAKSIFAALLLLVAGLQTAWGQGFRVYKSDGTVAQFSLRTDSIVFYDGIGSDVDFGPFTPVNECIAGTWYKIKEELTFGEDGTTNYSEGATYKFFPYLGSVVIYNASGVPADILKVYEVTKDRITVSSVSGKEKFFLLTRTPQPQPVTEIALNETAIYLKPSETFQLSATVMPEDADNRTVTWASSDPNIARVYDDGLVNAKADGSCTITCSGTDGSGTYAECQVTVVTDMTHGTTDGHEWVDLGLPSGTLWATCNVGASKPESTATTMPGARRNRRAHTIGPHTNGAREPRER